MKNLQTIPCVAIPTEDKLSVRCPVTGIPSPQADGDLTVFHASPAFIAEWDVAGFDTCHFKDDRLFDRWLEFAAPRHGEYDMPALINMFAQMHIPCESLDELLLVAHKRKVDTHALTYTLLDNSPPTPAYLCFTHPASTSGNVTTAVVTFSSRRLWDGEKHAVARFHDGMREWIHTDATRLAKADYPIDMLDIDTLLRVYPAVDPAEDPEFVRIMYARDILDVRFFITGFECTDETRWHQ